MTSGKTVRIAQIMGKWVGGGVEAVVMNYYQNIDRNRVQFDFIFDEDSAYIPYKEVESLGGKVILIPPYQHVVAYHKVLKNVLEEGHYQIAHSHVNTLSVFSLWAAKSAGVPIRIAHSHSTTNNHEFVKNSIKRVLRPFSKHFATSYMACSALAAKWMFGDKTYRKGEVYVLNDAIDLSRFEYNEQERTKIRAQLGLGEGTLTVGNVGRFVRQKNQLFLIDTFKAMHAKQPDSVLLIVGQGPLEQELMQKAKESGVGDAIHFLGQRSDVQNLYQAMDVFCLPSLYEGFGMVVVEAQVAGLPCVVSTQLPDVVNISKHVDFVSLERSPDIWAKHLLVAAGQKRASYATQAREEGFDITEEAQKLETYYLKQLAALE